MIVTDMIQKKNTNDGLKTGYWNDELANLSLGITKNCMF